MADRLTEVKVSIVIPVFNQWHLTRQCLTSLREHTHGDQFEVFVVDNGSTDETKGNCLSLGNTLFGQQFFHIRLENNINFGPACNIGAKQSTANLLFFLNNDTILTPNWLPPLLAALDEEPNIGAVGPLLLYPEVGLVKNRVQHLGIAVEPQLYPVHLYEFFPQHHPAVQKKRYYQALTGAGLLLSKNLFEECGGFYEEYINGGEDIDLCCQIRKKQKKLTCVTESYIHHLASQTPGRHKFEQHNARVLKSRCLTLLFPDLHFFIDNDGYEMRLTYFLKPYLTLPKRRRKIFEKQVQGAFDSNKCEMLLEKEPLWLAGYEKIAHHFESNNDFTSASHYRFLQAIFFPERKNFVKLLKTSRRAGCEEQKVEFAKNKLYRMDYIVSPTVLQETAIYMIDYTKRINQPKVAALYENWLKTYTTK
jgi:GT2 family glycosyltransferase